MTDEDKAWFAERFDAVNKRLDDLTRFTLDLRAETSRHSLTQQLDFTSNALLNIQPLNKAMVELGSLMGQMARSEQHATDRHFALETRVAQLEEKLSKLHPAA